MSGTDIVLLSGLGLLLLVFAMVVAFGIIEETDWYKHRQKMRRAEYEEIEAEHKEWMKQRRRRG